MKRTTPCLLLTLFCYALIGQSTKNETLTNQEQAYSDYFSLAMNNWCGVFSGYKAIDPCVYNEQNAKTLTGISYQKSQHLKLLKSAISCKSNQHRLEAIDFLIQSELLDKKDKLELLKYAYACHQVTGKSSRDLKSLGKKLKQIMGKEAFALFKYDSKRDDLKESNYQIFLKKINAQIQEYNSLEKVKSVD